MPQIIKNEAGEEVEVYSKEELEQAAEAKAQEERERLEAEKQEALEAAEAEKEELQTKLTKLEEKDLNFSKFRSQKEKNQNQDQQEDIKSQIDNLNKKIDELSSQARGDLLTDFIADKIGEDKDKKEKFDYYFKRLGSEAKTKTEIQKAANEALVLATGGEYQGNDQSGLSVGADQNYRQQNQGQPSSEALQMGEKLGVSTKDREKYGKKK